MSTILLIDGHPNPHSLCAALAEAYASGAAEAGAEVDRLPLRQLAFDPVLRQGQDQADELELLSARRRIEAADHLVLVTPLWWGSVPALLKGFFDRALARGWAYRYDGKGNPHGLLAGRSARVLMTTDSPGWYLRWLQGNPTERQLVRSTLKFCGLKPVKLDRFGPVHSSTAELRERWLQQARATGAADALTLARRSDDKASTDDRADTLRRVRS